MLRGSLDDGSAMTPCDASHCSVALNVIYEGYLCEQGLQKSPDRPRSMETHSIACAASFDPRHIAQ